MLRPKQGIKALLAIANPQGLSETFTPINVPQEQELAENALRHVPLTTLTRRGSATLRAIIEGIKREPTLSISCATALSGSKAPCCGWKMRPGMPPASPAKISPRVWARWKEFPAWSSYAPAKAPVPAIPHATRWSPRPHVSQRGRAGGIGDAGQAFDVCGNAIYPGVFQTAGGAWRSRSRYRQCAGKIMDSPDWWIPVVLPG